MSDIAEWLRLEAARNAQMQGDKEHQTNRRRKTFRGRNHRLTEAANRITELEAELEQAKTLLSVAKCPDTNCDGDGTVWLSNHEHENGEVEPEIHQCQWCDERKAALQQQEIE